MAFHAVTDELPLLPFIHLRRCFPASPVLHFSLVLFYIALEAFLCTEAHDIVEVKYNVTEDQPVGTYVGNVILDTNLSKLYSSDVIRLLQFRFMRQHSPGFEVDASSGVIRTSSVIDREVVCPGEPTCNNVRLDIGIQPVEFFRIIRVMITIVDVNDHDPVFVRTDRVHLELSESAAVGTALVLPGAADPDSPPFSIKHYSLQTIPESDNFLLDSTVTQVDGDPGLRLVLVKNLDREQVSEYRMTVTAFDGDTPPRTGTLEVHIDVLDANDNSPVFDREKYEVSIPEDLPLRSVVLQVSATDRDKGPNSQLLYFFSQFTSNAYGHLFGIVNTTGEIYVKGTIDHETFPVCHLFVVAQDLGPDPVPSTAMVVVNIEDVNDNSPKILYDSMSDLESADAEVREDAAVGTFVAHLTVVDEDSGENGRFNCSLADDRNFQMKALLSETEFQIHLATPVDRELQEVYNLTVMCTDLGLHPRTATQNILVVVTDVNDWDPSFGQHLYQTELIENNYIGAFVIQVSASDRDKGDNSDIVYSLASNATDFLRMDPSTGIITALVSFDREATQGMTFQVIAHDRGSPPRSGSTTVVLVISDVNDNKPTSTVPFYRFSVAENEPPVTDVGVIAAVDTDSGVNGEVFYVIAPGPSATFFQISSESGALQTTVSLDREETAVHYLKVIASDRGVPSLTSTIGVSVLVTDANDNSPKFEYPSPLNDSVHVPHLAPLGYEIARVRAFDADAGQNARLTFRFSNSSLTEYRFRIDNSTGIVTVDGDLTLLDGRRFDLRIVASDGGSPMGRESIALLHIFVNRSALLVTSEGFRLLTGRHLTIVIALAIACGFITAGLIITIIVMRRRKLVKYEHHYNCRTAALRMFPSQSTTSMVRGGGGGGGGIGDGGSGSVDGSRFVHSSSEAGSTTLFREAFRGSRNPVAEDNRVEMSSSTKKLLQTNPRGSEWSVAGKHHEAMTTDPKAQPLLQASPTKISSRNDDEDRNSYQLLQSSRDEDGNRSANESSESLTREPETGSRKKSTVPQIQKCQAEIEVNHLLEILKKERPNDAGSLHSADGSNTDSGRGPSEEGEAALKHFQTKTHLSTVSKTDQDGTLKPPYPATSSSRVQTIGSTHGCLTGSSSPKNGQVHPGFPVCVPNHYVLDQRFSARHPVTDLRPSMRYNSPHTEFPRTNSVPMSCEQTPHQQCSFLDLSHRPHDSVYPNGRPPAFAPVNTTKPSVSESSRYTAQPDYRSRETTDLGRSGVRNLGAVPMAFSRGWEDDDDAATTTSGSYVVDPKELCEEIDELFFKVNGKLS